MQHILNRWIRYVEATGHELAVTLLVGGTTISGYLTPRLRHDEWVKEILLRAVHEGGRSSIPAVGAQCRRAVTSVLAMQIP